MRRYVLDASIAVKWFLIEEHTDAALRIRGQPTSLHIPEFFFLEFGHVLYKKQRRNELAADECVQMLQGIQAVPMQRYRVTQLVPAAFDVALQLGSGLYDCIYLTLAAELDCPFITADRRLVNKVRRSELAEYILWIEDLPAA